MSTTTPITQSNPPAKRPLVYKLYLYRDRNDELVFRAKWKWGPFWRWYRVRGYWNWSHRIDGDNIAEWGCRDHAMEGINRHAANRRQKMKPWRTLVVVEEVSV